MRLIEMKNHLPEKAGVARLSFTMSDAWSRGTNPHREKNEINLPINPGTEFFPLMGNDQFVLKRSLGAHDGCEIWFGGTDEEPFLVRLKDEAFDALVGGGEEGFFDALKPRSVKSLEKDLNVTAKRQGDIFAVELPYPWEELERIQKVCLGRDLNHEKIGVGAIQLFETRHSIRNGICAPWVKIVDSLHMVASGVMNAPDHGPLELKMPHVIIQADNLFDPKKAD